MNKFSFSLSYLLTSNCFSRISYRLTNKMKHNFLVPCLVIWTIACFRTAHQLEIVYAVNCGGDAHTDSNGINYQKDPSTEGAAYTFPQTMTEISEHDRPMYQTCRYKNPSLSYDLPLTGDGWYGLLLHFADDSSTTGHKRRFKVTLNGQHTLLADLDLYKSCGENNVCNHIFYFKVCQRTLHYARQNSTIWDVKKLNVEIRMHTINAIINGILLVKGVPGEALAIVGTKTVFFIDPKNEVQCEGSQTIVDPGNTDNSGQNQCATNSPVSFVLNVYGSTKQTFRIVSESIV
jgi:Malectin domain